MEPLKTITVRNIHAQIAPDLGQLPAEQLDTLLAAPGVRIERIVSMGHRSPDGFWYDQPEDEFVLLVSGYARLQVEQHSELRLGAGDWVHIPAHVRHRVEWTDPSCPAVWLAILVGPARA